MRNSDFQLFNDFNERLAVIEKKVDQLEKLFHAAFAADKSLAAAIVFQGLMELPSFKRLIDNLHASN